MLNVTVPLRFGNLVTSYSKIDSHAAFKVKSKNLIPKKQFLQGFLKLDWKLF